MLRTNLRRAVVAGATVAASAMALQGTGLALPTETVTVDSWGTPGSCYARTVSADINPTENTEFVNFQLFVTVGGHTYAGSVVNTGPSTGGKLAATVSVSAPCSVAGGQPAIYNLYVQGYKGSLALPDYLFDQWNAYSVCNLTGPSCIDTPAVELDANTPVAFVGHLP
ncbi:MAG: hypothetical protein JO079_11610 [Frankiaceae bacterium]|nr:hypothetical protein [Frankiaceae bacterium]